MKPMANSQLRHATGGWTAIPNTIMEMLGRGELSKNGFILYCYLSYRVHNGRQVAFPSYARIMADTGMSRAVVAATLKELIGSDLLIARRRGSLSNEYTVNIPIRHSDETEPEDEEYKFATTEARNSTPEPQKFGSCTSEVQKLNTTNKEYTNKEYTNKRASSAEKLAKYSIAGNEQNQENENRVSGEVAPGDKETPGERSEVQPQIPSGKGAKKAIARGKTSQESIDGLSPPGEVCLGREDKPQKPGKDLESLSTGATRSTVEQQNAVRKRLEEKFSSLTALPAPTGQAARSGQAAARWWKPLRNIAEAAGWDADLAEQAMTEAFRRMTANDMDISAPQSIEKCTLAAISRLCTRLSLLEGMATPKRIVVLDTRGGRDEGERRYPR